MFQKFRHYLFLPLIGTLLSVLVMPWQVFSAPNEDVEVHGVLVRFKNSENIVRLKLDPAIALDAAIEELSQRPDVDLVEPNYAYRASAFPNDPEIVKQWYLNAINVREAWSRELVVRESKRNIREAVIAIIDTGVDISHPDLKANIWTNPNEIPRDGIDNDHNGFVDDVNGWDFISKTNDPSPKFTSGFVKDAVVHGTIVAGIAAAVGHNTEGIAGIAWHAKLMPLRALDSQGNGDAFDVYNAVNYAIQNKADIINMSFIGADNSQILADVIKKAYDAGIVVVAAAGNSTANEGGTNFDVTKFYPICSDVGGNTNFIVGVAAVDRANQRSRFTNYGSSCIDLAAPGEEFFSTVAFNQSQSQFNSYYGGLYSGTSLSAPLVSGALALIKTVRPDLSSEQLISAITGGVKKVDNRVIQGLGAGVLDVFSSLALAETMKSGSATSNSAAAESHLLVIGLGSGSFPQLKIFKDNETIFKSFFAYAATFQSSVNVATGDVDGDGDDDIVTGTGPASGAHVRIFDIEGRVQGQFFAYDSKMRFGVNVAVGDIDGDKIAEIVTSQNKGGKPEIKIFKKDGTLVKSFMAYDKGFLGGVHIALGDITGDGVDEIITGAGAGGGPHVRIFDRQGNVVGQFFAFNRDSKSGVRVAAGDLNGDVFDEIVVTPEVQTSAVVKIFRPSDFQTISEFFAFAPDFTKGAVITVGDFDSDGKNEVVAGSATGGQALVRIFDWRGSLKKEILTHSDFYKGGARPAIMRYAP